MKLPKNKQLFKELIPFAQRIIKLLQKNKIPPVIYGSFAHFYHTKDKNMKVNDIDIIIKEKDFKKTVKLLEDNKIKFKYYPEWPGIIIKKAKLKVEIDAIANDYKTIKEKTLFKKNGSKIIDFYGIKIGILKLNDLIEMYPITYNRSTEDKARIKKKIKNLEKFLKRKLV